MKDKSTRALGYVRSTVLAALGIVAFVALTFVATGGFTFQAYSDRLLWAGLIITLLVVPVSLAIARNASMKGETPGDEDPAARSAPSPLAPEPGAQTHGEARARSLDRGKGTYAVALRLWLISLLCIGASIAVGALLVPTP